MGGPRQEQVNLLANHLVCDSQDANRFFFLTKRIDNFIFTFHNTNENCFFCPTTSL